MTMKLKHCPYCDVQLPEGYLKNHIGHAHDKKEEDTKKRGKIVMIFTVIGLSIVIGMVWGLLL